MSETWKDQWLPVVQAIGQELPGAASCPADAIEAGTLRRYLEPLEFGCPLHHDEQVARECGYDQVIAPYTATLSFTMPAMWTPGAPTLFPSDERNAQPVRSAVKPVYPAYFPPFSGYFATDIDIDFIRPAMVGERVMRRGNKLVACEPKETRVGRGAFVKFESELVTEHGEVISRMRTGVYLYEPHEGGGK
jgi:hypothetical protein